MTAGVGSVNRDSVLSYRIPGTPESQGSARAFVVGGRARITSTNAKLKSWRRDAISAAQEAMGGRPPFEGAVRLTVTFCFARPASHYGKRGLRPTAPPVKITAPDLDKLVRALSDSLIGAQVVRDDSRIVAIDAAKVYSARPGVDVEVMAW